MKQNIKSYLSYPRSHLKCQLTCLASKARNKRRLVLLSSQNAEIGSFPFFSITNTKCEALNLIIILNSNLALLFVVTRQKFASFFYMLIN